MSIKALKVVVEVEFRAISCPGVRLPSRNDVYFCVYFMDYFHHSRNVPAVFPLLFRENMIFEKIFRQAVDPEDIAVLLEYETVRVDLIQLTPPMGETLACFEEDARSFLFPEPKRISSFSGVDRKVLMTRSFNFPGIAPRLEFSTKTTIVESSVVPMTPVMERNRKCSDRCGTSSSSSGKQHVGMDRKKPPISWSTLKTDPGHSTQLGSANTRPADSASTSQFRLTSWPGARPSAVPHHSALFTSSKSLSPVTFSTPDRRKSLESGLNRGISKEEPSFLMDYYHGPDPAHSREWAEVLERVQGLLTTPKAVRRLIDGATVSEVDRMFASP